MSLNMMASTTTTDSNHDMFDIVHKLATLSKTSPPGYTQRTMTVEFPTSPFMTDIDRENFRDTPTRTSEITFSKTSNHISPVHRQSVSSGNINQNLNSSPGRRIKPVSAPRRPPDIQNMTLFPPIDDSLQDHQQSQKERFSKSPTTPGLPSPASAIEIKLRNLEIKLQGREVNNIVDCRSQSQLGSLNLLTPKRIATDVNKKRQFPRSAELFAEITPEIASKIDHVACEYSSSLDNNLSQNILEEISLLLQLIASSRPLTSNELEYTNISSKIDGNLITVAQQVFFVIKVLTLQLNTTLVSIDPEVVQLLVEKYPHRIPKPFRKCFQSWVETQICKRKGSIIEPSRKPSEFHHCVTFRSETDGRSNFPSQGNFHAFCKQRDLFYSIKSLWEERKSAGTIIEHNSSFGKNNNSSNFSNKQKQSRGVNCTSREIDPLHTNIKALFNLDSSWVNLSHFAALFSAQYIIDSMEESRGKTVIQGDVMKGLQLSNPDRFAKLDNRMSSISELESSSKDCFTFQQYFITTASSPAFNQHLVDRISFEIRQIENSFDSTEIESISEDEQEFLFKKCVLLAKLLGFIAFLPYREDSKSSSNVSLDRETLSSKHMELRKCQNPSLELFAMLCTAIKRSRLTFTLPWILEFLFCGDYISLRLPAYKQILTVICDLYHNWFLVNNNSSRLCPENKNFLRFWCGKFFSVEVFPVSLLYNTENNILEEVIKSWQPSTPHDHTSVGSGLPMDAKSSLGEQLSRYYFAVKFHHMKYILHSGLQQQQSPIISLGNGPGQHRHIRPTSAKPTVAPKTISSDVELQRQLECSFFDSNSASVKRTVDFVSDRIASNYVKILRKTMTDRRNELAKQRIFVTSAAEVCGKIMLQGVKDFIGSKCEISLNLLIGEALSVDALKVCQQITERYTVAKISQWIEIHIKPEMFPEIPLPDEVPVSEQANKSAPLNVTVDTKKTEDITSFNVMISLHRCMKRLHEKKPVSESVIDDILNCTSLGQVPGMISTLLDFGVTLITFSPLILNEVRQKKLIALWKPCWNSDCQLLSPRNILILNDCSENLKTNSWARLEEIILLLIKEKLLDFETVEQDCFRLLREDLSIHESKQVSQLLKKLISSTHGDNKDGPSREVVDWISWFCSEEQEGAEF